MVTRRGIALAVAVAAGGLVAVLMMPGREQAPALFALLLLCGASAGVVLLRRIVPSRPSSEAVLWGSTSSEDEGGLRQLDDIVRDVETVLEFGHDTRGDLSSRLRIVVAARLAARRGIDLDGEPERAREAIDDELTWALVREHGRYEPVEDRALGVVELRRVLASVERI